MEEEAETTEKGLEIQLTDVEARVLGCLIEKEHTTPEYYPLSLNSLTTACNQKSNRDPVMSLEEADVAKALDGLKFKRLVWFLSTAGGRVPKYEHNLANRWPLSKEEMAVLCVLMLRGPQTIGEIRIHSGRIHDFKDLEGVEQTLQGLIEREDGPFVVRLPRQAGRKDNRYAHLLCGEPEITESEEPAGTAIPSAAKADRIGALEMQVEQLKQQMESLRAEFDKFRQAFE